MSHPPHWLTLSNIGAAPDTVNLYDSSHLSIPSNILDDIASFVHTPNSKLTVDHVNTQVQLNGTDCGVFTIAYAVSLSNGEDPCHLQYTDMRKLIWHPVMTLTLSFHSPHPFKPDDENSPGNIK